MPTVPVPADPWPAVMNPDASSRRCAALGAVQLPLHLAIDFDRLPGREDRGAKTSLDRGGGWRSCRAARMVRKARSYSIHLILGGHVLRTVAFRLLPRNRAKHWPSESQRVQVTRSGSRMTARRGVWRSRSGESRASMARLALRQRPGRTRTSIHLTALRQSAHGRP